MLTQKECETWAQFIEYVKDRCSPVAFENWILPIKLIESSSSHITLEVPNVFVQNYLIDNYKNELKSFVNVDADGSPAINFVVNERKKDINIQQAPVNIISYEEEDLGSEFELKLNSSYLFDTFIEGPSNQFVKSAAIGIANKPGKTYNPLFIHGGVGLGKTHLLHAIGHFIKDNNKKLKVHCITTEAFINDLVDHLKNKSVEKMKKFYRSLDIFLIDDIQFLQNRLNFEDEFCNTFETLINQNKQIVITSDKPPGLLKLSERIVARMEWGLVAHVGIPDLETRVAILQHKAEQKGLSIPNSVAFFIAEHIFSNVRKLEGAINQLTAQCKLYGKPVTEETVEEVLGHLFQASQQNKPSVENILKTVATVFQIKLNDLKGTTRTKEVAIARQVAMFLAKSLISESLSSIGTSFGKTHSTILHSAKTIEEKLKTDDKLKRKIIQCQQHLNGLHAIIHN